MAVLNKIRQQSFFLILIIALALFAFVIQGVIDNPDAFSDSQDVVATINGKTINKLEFQQKVKNYQDRSGGRQTNTQAMNIIYNQELQKIVLDTEFETLGLSVGREEMRKLLKNSFSSYPEFQDEKGVFDFNRLNAFIANLKELEGEAAPLGNFMVNYDSWTTNEQNLAKNALQQTYYNLIKAGINTTVAEAKDEYLADAKTVDIKYVQIPYASVADSLVTVKKFEIKDFIKKHKESYTAEASTKIAYVEFEEVASEADENLIKKELLDLKHDKPEYNEIIKDNDTITGFNNTNDVEGFINSNSDIKFNSNFLRFSQLSPTTRDSLSALSINDYFGPYREGNYFKLSKLIAKKQMADTVKVRHILIPYVGAQRADASITQSPNEAQKTADSLLTEITSRRAKFVDLLKHSFDKVSNKKNGEIKFAYNAGMAMEFKEFSFNNTVGDIGVVGTSFGYHVIEILEQNTFNTAYQFATVAKKIEPSQQTLDNVFNEMSKFEIAIKKADFDTVAKEKGLRVKSMTLKELDENITGLGSQREVVRWTFNEETEVGDNKYFSISGFGFIVAKLTARNEKGLMTVEAASKSVLPKIKKEKKAQLIHEKITGTKVQEVANNQGQTIKNASALSLKNTTLAGAGKEPKVVGVALALKDGQTSQLINGELGVYLVEITKTHQVTTIDNYTPIINRLSRKRKNMLQNKVYNALRDAADIEDNRTKTVY